VWVREPLTPVIVSGKVPAGVLAVGETVSVEAPVSKSGVNVPVAPVGSPLTLNVTLPVKPLVRVMLTL